MRIPLWFVMVWVVVIGLVALGGSALAYTFVRDRAAELDEVLDLPDPPQLIGASDNAAAPTATVPAPSSEPAEPTTAPADSPTGTAESAPETVTDSGEDVPPLYSDPRRVTILLMGIDQRAGETGSFPTDTMILFSLDPGGNTAAILSIPRDLWVEYPAPYNTARINTANIIGDELNYPGGGGPALAMKTVERELGVTVNHYVLINFEVFTKVINAIGPVEVCPSEPIDDDRYPDGSYGYITIHFDAGCQELDAEQLLQYARTRHGDSDIGRSSRQQEVILAVRQKILTTGGVMALLPEVPALWESVQANIRTDLTLEEILSLARKAEEITPENIRQGQISFGEVLQSSTPEGDQILIPIKSDIRLLIEDLFRPAGTPSTRP